jgi:glycosyltransferase involved in cell wall biosynthesis
VKILFVHQNFPAQFKFLAPALVNQGHDVSAMHMTPNMPPTWAGVSLTRYDAKRGNTPNIHAWVLDIETKVIRGEAFFRAATELKNKGYQPDIVVAHHGWGETLFVKEVWPNARLGIYCEYYYYPNAYDVGFDPEFVSSDPGDACRVKLKNVNNLLHFEFADAGISPTHWQASTFPTRFREKITVIHDGIDTQALAPDPNAFLKINQRELNRQTEVITFVNRNLEPYRGYHVFMRTLPEVLKRRPNATILIVGGNDVSYGARPPGGKSWKDIFIQEVRPQISEADWRRVYFLGNIPYKEFVHMLQISSVHVYLTYPFVLSWSLLESLSLGCAVVASNTMPLKEVITHEQNGLLVDFFDRQGLANEICRLLENPDLRRSLGRNARSFAQSNYDLNSVCLPRQLKWVEALAS